MNEIEKAIEHYREVKRKKTLCEAHGVLDKAYLIEFEYADIVLSALEKQIPKPALLEKLRIQTKATCPNCKEPFAWVVKTDDLPAYCPKCGQKIADWWNWGKERQTKNDC